MALIVVATNKTGLAPISDYNFEVLVGDGSPERSHTIAHGSIEGHARADGWKALIARILKEAPDGD